MAAAEMFVENLPPAAAEGAVKGYGATMSTMLDMPLYVIVALKLVHAASKTYKKFSELPAADRVACQAGTYTVSVGLLDDGKRSLLSWLARKWLMLHLGSTVILINLRYSGGAASKGK